jgi:hypothetical protein
MALRIARDNKNGGLSSRPPLLIEKKSYRSDSHDSPVINPVVVSISMPM